MKSASGKRTPCDDCFPEILPDNKDAVFIYLKGGNQVIVAGMGDIIGLNYLAFREMMDAYKIQNQNDCWEKVQIIFREIRELAEERKESEKDSPSSVSTFNG